MTDLSSALELAAEDMETRDLTHSVLATARRRRTRRRAAVACVAAGVAVAGVVIVPMVLDPTPDRTLPSEQPTPAPTPSQSPPVGEGAIAPPISEDVVQGAWDPSTADNLPRYVIEDLPEVLVPGGSGPTPGDSTGALALARSDRDELSILYADSAWFDLDRPQEAGELWDSSLSRDGTRMAVVGEGGLFWCPTAETCPSWNRVELPERNMGEGQRITWTRDSRRLVLSGFETGFLVDLDSGETTELPYLGELAAFDVAPDGRIVAGEREPRSVVEWEGTEQAAPPVSSGDLGGLSDFAVYEDAIAATRIDLAFSDPKEAADGDGLMALERDGLGTRAFLPFTGRSGEWVDAELVKPLQWINKLTVLVSVQVGDDVHLVTWDTWQGSKGLVATYPASYDMSLRDLYPA